MNDPLSEIFGLLRPRAVGSKVIKGAGAWAVKYSAFGQPSFCTLLEGSCLLKLDGQEAICLEEGDFVFLPTTPGFVLSSFEEAVPVLTDPKPNPASHIELRHGKLDSPVNAVLLGGYFEFESPDSALLTALLPAMLHVKGAEKLAAYVHLIDAEAKASQPGKNIALEKLVELLLIEALRTSNGLNTPSGLLKGLSDERLAEVIRQLHLDPSRPWKVEQLAAIAAMSRSSFFDKFTSTIGVPPMEYLFFWRMALAKNLLLKGRLSLEEVAHRVGYLSASSFSIAFSRFVGLSPGRYAKEARLLQLSSG